MKTVQECLRFEGVCKSFGQGSRRVVALDSIHATVMAGRITGLVGPDGAGKTTLLRLAAGLLSPDTGRVSLFGTDGRFRSPELSRSLGYMPQRLGLYEELTVQENLTLYADLQGVPRRGREERIGPLLELAGLAPFRTRLARNLSGGMKQKLALLCSLVREPKLLLLDEPTVGVDPLSRRELWEILFGLRKEKSLTILVSTSYLEEAELCEEVLLLYQGRLLGQGEPANIASRALGKTFLVSCSWLTPRALHFRVARLPHVWSAVMEGEGVRVLYGGKDLADRLVANGLSGCHVEEIAPRLADGFLATLAEEAGLRERSNPITPTAPAESFQIQRNREVIVVRNLRRYFGSFEAVKGISFSIRAGEVFGLLGANGAGKSTTFRMLCGLLPPSGGVAQVAGIDLRTGAPSARARIGYVAQGFSLYGWLTVRQNLEFFARIYGLSGSRRKERIGWAEKQFGLKDYSNAPAGDLPLGYKRRLALACALLHEPEILFLDEPTSGMDPAARQELWLAIDEMAQRGVTVLITTHHLEEAEFCDRVVILAAGRILAEGTPAEIKARFQSPGQPMPTMEEAFITLLKEHGVER